MFRQLTFFLRWPLVAYFALALMWGAIMGGMELADCLIYAGSAGAGGGVEQGPAGLM